MSSVRLRFISWLIERHPRAYFRWKRIGKHRLCEDREFLAQHAAALRAGEALQVLEERYNLWALTRAVTRLPGACAEVGVYRGGSAKFIAAAKGDAPLHLFDTFGGMPAVNPATDGAFYAGQFDRTSLAFVQRYLAGYAGVHFHPGFFPESARPLEAEPMSFKFVHLDVDIRASTLAALEWFYPRMVPGGVILTHDYNDVTVPGTKSAFDAFFTDKPETVVPLWFTQAVVTKA
ncbi:MAG: class I SAM-dependent methyltransferase [Candidatus Didemnitutus sp.]|nr:class I SAM-dependent methyltransferase [Candidatus Didemnitutus sp.]